MHKRLPEDASRPGASRPDEPARSETVGQSPQIFRCSYCGAPYDRHAVKTVPFCSVRCSQIDLKNWLTESYGLPYEGDDRPEELDSGEESDSGDGPN